MDADNKGDLRHMVNIMVCWDFYEDELMVHNIDSDAYTVTNIDAAHALDFISGILIVTELMRVVME